MTVQPIGENKVGARFQAVSFAASSRYHHQG